MIGGDRAHGTCPRFRRIIKPRSVSGVGVGARTVQKQANNTVCIHIPDACAGIGSYEKCTRGQKPNRADLRQTGCGCRLTLAAATGGAITSNDGSSDAVCIEAVDAMSAAVRNNNVSAGIDHEHTELLEAGRKIDHAAGRCPFLHCCSGANVSERFVVAYPEAAAGGDSTGDEKKRAHRAVLIEAANLSVLQIENKNNSGLCHPKAVRLGERDLRSGSWIVWTVTGNTGSCDGGNNSGGCDFPNA